jgi:predicted MPP superfamily phosphohydrolase
MKITNYSINTNKKGIDMNFACVSDLHARPYKKVVDALKSLNPDAVLLPGDIVEIAAEYMRERNQNGLNFLKECSLIAPCFYTYGNHEIFFSHAKGENSKTPDASLEKVHHDVVLSYGINLINDSYTAFCKKTDDGVENKVLIGGLVCGRDMDPALNMPLPDLDFLQKYSDTDGFKILLCHYPHYYNKYVKETNIDLMLSGHAHGGQWRIFGRGIYAPHQGLFPKYTSGLHDSRHIISRGAVNNVSPIPRFFNPCEILCIKVKSTD